MANEPSEKEVLLEPVQCTQEQTAGFEEEEDKLSEMGKGPTVITSNESSLDFDGKEKSEDERKSKIKKRIRFAPAEDLEDVKIISYNDGPSVQVYLRTKV